MRAAVKYSPAGVLFRVSPVPDFIKATVPGVAGGTDKETAFIELDPCLSGDAGTPLPLLQGKTANHRTLSVNALPWKLKVINLKTGKNRHIWDLSCQLPNPSN
jgi:hypothetical protein